MFPDVQFNEKKFTQAYQLVLSRSFLVRSGETARRVLIPIVDMFNHLPLPDAQGDNSVYELANAIVHFNTNDNILAIIPTREIEENEEVFYIFFVANQNFFI